MSAAEVLRERVAQAINRSLVQQVRGKLIELVADDDMACERRIADAVLDMLREAGLLAEGFTEVVEDHFCYPGCEPGCDIARTRQLVGPVEVIERRRPLTQADTDWLRGQIAEVRAARKARTSKCACCRCNGIVHDDPLDVCFIEHQHGCTGLHSKGAGCNQDAVEVP